MSKIDLTPFISEGNESEIVIELPCKSTERAFFNGYQTWTASYEVRPTDTNDGIKRFFRLFLPFPTFFPGLSSAASSKICFPQTVR